MVHQILDLLFGGQCPPYTSSLQEDRRWWRGQKNWRLAWEKRRAGSIIREQYGNQPRPLIHQLMKTLQGRKIRMGFGLLAGAGFGLEIEIPEAQLPGRGQGLGIIIHQ